MSTFTKPTTTIGLVEQAFWRVPILHGMSLESVLEVDEDAEEELDKPGTTIGTKFSVLKIIRIPSLMRCGF